MTILFSLLFKGALGGGGGGALGLLFLLAIIALVGYALIYIVAVIIAMMNIIFDKTTNDSYLDKEYEGPLSMNVKVAFIALGVAGWLTIIILPAARDAENQWTYFFLALLYPFLFIFFYRFWKHFYFRRLYKMSEKKAMRSIRLSITGIFIIACCGVYAIVYTSAGSRIDRFDKTIIKAEQSPVVETDCFLPDIHLGMNRADYEMVIERMIEHDSVTVSDFDRKTIYVVYSTDRDRSMSITPTFSYGSLAMLHLGDYGGAGSDHLKWDIRKSGRLKQFKPLRVPSSDVDSKGNLHYPRHMHDFCNDYENNKLYNYDDDLYIKDNMLIVFTFMGISFIDMPQVKNY